MLSEEEELELALAASMAESGEPSGPSAAPRDAAAASSTHEIDAQMPGVLLVILE